MKKIIAIALSIVFICGLVHADLGKLTPPSFYQPTLKEKIFKDSLIDLRGSLMLDYDFIDIPETQGTTKDKSGHKTDGTLVGSAYRVIADGVPSVRFDGTNDYIDTNSTLQSVFSDSFTISCWMKPNDKQPPAGQMIWGVNNAASEDGLYFDIHTNGQLFFYYESNNVGVQATASSVLVDGIGDWIHVVCVANSTVGGADGLLMYLNGKLNGTASTAGITFADFAIVDNLYIGARNNAGVLDFKYKGEIANVRIYNDILTPKEIRQQYTYELWELGLAD